MSKSEKKLAIVFGSVLVLGLFGKYVYPSVVAPMFDYSAELTKATDESLALQEEFDSLETQLRRSYHEYLRRTGGANPSDVQDEMYERINRLLKSAKLSNASVKPGSPSIDRRTKVATLTISVSAKGKFKDCIGFIKGVYRIPYLVRFNTVKLSPIGTPQKSRGDDVKLDAEIETMILPEQKVLGAYKGKQPREKDDRLAMKDTRRLEGWDPFSPYYEPAPTPRPTPVATPKPTPRVIVETGPPTDPDAADTVVRAITRYGVDEVLLADVRTDQAHHVALGEELDGGDLILVHVRGVVVEKYDDKQHWGFWVYPLGLTLNDRVRIEDAEDWPEVQWAMVKYFEALKEQLAAGEDGAPIVAVADAQADAGTVGFGEELGVLREDGVVPGAVHKGPKSNTGRAKTATANGPDEPQPAEGDAVKQDDPNEVAPGPDNNDGSGSAQKKTPPPQRWKGKFPPKNSRAPAPKTPEPKAADTEAPDTETER